MNERKLLKIIAEELAIASVESQQSTLSEIFRLTDDPREIEVDAELETMARDLAESLTTAGYGASVRRFTGSLDQHVIDVQQPAAIKRMRVVAQRDKLSDVLKAAGWQFSGVNAAHGVRRGDGDRSFAKSGVTVSLSVMSDGRAAVFFPHAAEVLGVA